MHCDNRSLTVLTLQGSKGGACSVGQVQFAHCTIAIMRSPTGCSSCMTQLQGCQGGAVKAEADMEGVEEEEGAAGAPRLML